MQTTRFFHACATGVTGMQAIYIEIDDADFQAKIRFLADAMNPANFERAMYRIFTRTGQHVRKIVKEDVPHEYEISPSKVGAAVKAAQVSGLSCIIPIRDRRGPIGSQYKASGGAHGWASLKRKYRVKAKIVKGGTSTLPARAMAGYPPFRNLGSKLGGLTFTRTSGARGPILKVSGIAIPQMPVNRSEAEIQKDIYDWMKAQVERECMAVLGM